MSLSYNGTNISKIVYNGTNLSKVIFNGTTVWTSGPTLDLKGYANTPVGYGFYDIQAFNTSGKTYLALGMDAGSSYHQLYLFDTDTMAYTPIAQTGYDTMYNTAGVSIGNDIYIYGSSHTSDKYLFKMSGSNITGGEISATSNYQVYTRFIKANNGKVYFYMGSDQGSDIYKFDGSNFTAIFGSLDYAPSSVSKPSDIILGRDGNIYIVSGGKSSYKRIRVYKLDTSTDKITQVAEMSTSYPAEEVCICQGPDNTLYVSLLLDTSSDKYKIYKVTGSTLTKVLDLTQTYRYTHSFRLHNGKMYLMLYPNSSKSNPINFYEFTGTALNAITVNSSTTFYAKKVELFTNAQGKLLCMCAGASGDDPIIKYELNEG